MPTTRHLAFDLGAESGRALLGELNDGRLTVREIHRFATGMLGLHGRLHWNVFRLHEEILAGLRAAAGTPPDSIGIDTWGVDFGLLDRDGRLLGLPYAYRDAHTAGAMDSFLRRVPADTVYRHTGVQFLPFNSLFQLEALVRDDDPHLAAAADLLFMPDLFHYLLTGVKRTEFTFATTSQLYNPRRADWDATLLVALGLPRSLFQPIVPPATILGPLLPEVAAAVGLPPVPVVAVATHDTASAVAAVPAEGGDWAYLSSGTWSLLGIESPAPLITEHGRALNVSNEGGFGGTFHQAGVDVREPETVAVLAVPQVWVGDGLSFLEK